MFRLPPLRDVPTLHISTFIIPPVPEFHVFSCFHNFNFSLCCNSDIAASTLFWFTSFSKYSSTFCFQILLLSLCCSVWSMNFCILFYIFSSSCLQISLSFLYHLFGPLQFRTFSSNIPSNSFSQAHNFLIIALYFEKAW